MKFEPIKKSWLISQKNADSAGPLKYHEISTFFQSSPNFIKLAEHIWIIIKNMHVKFEPFQRSWLISLKKLTVPALWIIMKFQHFSKFTKFHQTCRTYLNHHQKHACEIWANSEKLTYFTEKCRQCRPFEISWNFNIFSKFTKFHQTCRIYWNHHQKHTCEIWAHSEKLYFFTEKCRQCRP